MLTSPSDGFVFQPVEQSVGHGFVPGLSPEMRHSVFILWVYIQTLRA
jgi:hypothetical protein